MHLSHPALSQCEEEASQHWILAQRPFYRDPITGGEGPIMAHSLRTTCSAIIVGQDYGGRLSLIMPEIAPKGVFARMPKTCTHIVRRHQALMIDLAH